MAIQTKTNVATISNPDGSTATYSYAYDDVALVITSVTVQNDLTPPRDVHLQLTRTSDGRVYGPWTAGPGTTTQTIPTNGQQRLGVTLDARGRIDGAEVQFW